MFKYLMNGCLFMVLMDKAGEGGAGGGGGGGGAGGEGGKGGEGAGDGKGAPDLSTVLARLDKLEKENAELKAKGAGGGGGDPEDLTEKARKEREAREAKSRDAKAIEAALKFSMGAREWAKTNANLLPKDIVGILDAADKETYESAVEKDAAIKSALVQDFFKVQANLDLLTPSQKSSIEDFLKLTKNGKQEKAQHLYDTIFEPTFEMLKRVKKAEQLRQDGHASSSDAETAYRDRMLNLSRKHYLGVKTDGA